VTIADEIVRLLRVRPAGMSDGAIARATGAARHQVSQRCRDLSDRGVLVRDASSGVTINRLAGTHARPDHGATEWFAAGRVHAALSTWLTAHRWQPRGPEPGADLVAVRGDTVLRLAVRGYPGGAADVRATQWFAHALLQGVRLRDAHPADAVALGLPDFARYRVLVAETETSLRALRVGAALVDAAGALSALAGAET